jgi:putative spermidine/putrescine transport system ATP-binding protein
MSPLLSIRGVTKRFADVTAVNDITLDVAQGEFVTFLGPSGSGKSTLLYMIAGLEDVTSGDIRLREASLLTVPPHKRNIGMVFQRYTLIPHMSVEDNIAFPLRVRGWSRERIAQRAAEMLRLVRLEDCRGRRPAQLSGGQQQRVALARALSYDPRILLMDEPLAALDKKLKEGMQAEIRRIHRETGVTVLYVTHDQEEALRLSDRIAVFNGGRIEQAATGADLYENPASRFVAGFIGNCNFLPVTISALHEGSATVRFPEGTMTNGVRLHADMRMGEGGVLLLRPEKLLLLRPDDPAAKSGLAALVKDVTYLGESLQVSLEMPWGQELSARVAVGEAAKAGLGIGAKAAVIWPANHGLLFHDRP